MKSTQRTLRLTRLLASVTVATALPWRASVAHGAERLVDFSLTPDGNFDNYTEQGVTFRAIGGVLTSTQFNVTPNGSRGIYGWDGIDVSSSRRMIAELAVPCVEVSVDLGDYNADADLALLEAYDVTHALIDRTTLQIARTAESMFTLTVRGAAIRQVVFGSDGQYPNSIFADNFSFFPVAEPTSGCILLFAFAGSLTYRCRRRSHGRLAVRC